MKNAKGLTPKQELFCKLFATEKEFFGNGTQAYIEAFDVDVTKPGKYNSARTQAYNLLTNHDILSRIDDYLELGGLNDATVDKHLLMAITQHADLNSKVKAISEYNKLRQRITEKQKVEKEITIKTVDYKNVDSDDTTQV